MLVATSTVAGCASRESAPIDVDEKAFIAAARHLNDDPIVRDAVMTRDPCDNGLVVDTAWKLVHTLAETDFRGCIVVTRDINLTHYPVDLPIKPGVTLVGQCGVVGRRPMVYTDIITPSHALFKIDENPAGQSTELDQAVRIDGLQFRGPANGSRSESLESMRGLLVTTTTGSAPSQHIVIANSEFNEWTESAIEVRGVSAGTSAESPADSDTHVEGPVGPVRLVGNYIHRNARDELGYGVVVSSGGWATIEGNTFDFNRHAIASDGGGDTGYVARFNYVLAGGYTEGTFLHYYNSHFDVHGTATADHYGGIAGEFYDIAFNTFRGDQHYMCVAYWCKTRAAFGLRGAPTVGAYFHDNVAVHENLDAAVELDDGDIVSAWDEDHAEFNFHPHGNQFDTDRSSELATGDFDRDGRTDVFVATGTAWFYSRGGTAPWEFLHASPKRTRELAFADIDNDGATDVLYRDGGTLGSLRSGAAPWATLTVTPVPLSETRFGDFDGDGKTDIFYTQAHQWHIWRGNTRTWTLAQTSALPISELRFGDFDAIPGTDVAAATSHMWAYSSAATGRWTKLNDDLKPSLSGAVIADFDNDGHSDIAFDEGHQHWVYSPTGRLALRTLRDGTGTAHYPPLPSLLIGNFGGAGDRVAAFYQAPPEQPPSGRGPRQRTTPPPGADPRLLDHIVIWLGDIRGPFSRLSWYPMR